MTAARQLIRERVRDVLRDGGTRAGTNVESNRPNPVSMSAQPESASTQLPIIIVYTRKVDSEIFDESPRRYRNRAEVVVECALHVTDETAIDDELDAFEHEVCNAILVDDTLAGTVNDIQLKSSSSTLDAEGARIVGAVIITFEAEFFTYWPAENSQTLDDLGTVHTEHSLEGAQGDPRDRAVTHTTGLDQ
jgi:hypothetical protein